MAVMSHGSFDELASSEEGVVRAMEWAVRQQASSWTTDREFMATLLELVHTLILVTLKIGGAKNIGKPMHIPRPWDKAKEAVGFKAFAKGLRRAR